jgi:hypothetical protein
MRSVRYLASCGKIAHAIVILCTYLRDTDERQAQHFNEAAMVLVWKVRKARRKWIVLVSSVTSRFGSNRLTEGTTEAAAFGKHLE